MRGRERSVTLRAEVHQEHAIACRGGMKKDNKSQLQQAVNENVFRRSERCLCRQNCDEFVNLTATELCVGQMKKLKQMNSVDGRVLLR